MTVVRYSEYIVSSIRFLTCMVLVLKGYNKQNKLCLLHLVHFSNEVMILLAECHEFLSVSCIMPTQLKYYVVDHSTSIYSYLFSNVFKHVWHLALCVCSKTQQP